MAVAGSDKGQAVACLLTNPGICTRANHCRRSPRLARSRQQMAAPLFKDSRGKPPAYLCPLRVGPHGENYPCRVSIRRQLIPQRRPPHHFTVAAEREVSLKSADWFPNESDHGRTSAVLSTSRYGSRCDWPRTTARCVNGRSWSRPGREYGTSSGTHLPLTAQ